MEPSLPLVAHTPRGSTIEAMGNNTYRVCDRNRHCRQVTGLWQAQEVLQKAERGGVSHDQDSWP
jgi:hypothetical protein